MHTRLIERPSAAHGKEEGPGGQQQRDPRTSLDAVAGTVWDNPSRTALRCSDVFGVGDERVRRLAEKKRGRLINKTRPISSVMEENIDKSRYDHGILGSKER